MLDDLFVMFGNIFSNLPPEGSKWGMRLFYALLVISAFVFLIVIAITLNII